MHLPHTNQHSPLTGFEPISNAFARSSLPTAGDLRAVIRASLVGGGEARLSQ